MNAVPSGRMKNPEKIDTGFVLVRGLKSSLKYTVYPDFSQTGNVCTPPGARLLPSIACESKEFRCIFIVMETDYSKIASRYDDNKVRLKKVDHQIGEVLESKPGNIKVLDLACGTGKYLKVQSEYYRDAPIQWMGVDRSKEMIAIAAGKKINASFICCDAEDFSIAPDSSIDYIRNEYAWHHFTNHRAVLKNIYRMLKPGGHFKMVNICPEYMKDYWVYFYFPGTRLVDKARFINSRELYQSFIEQGFDVRIKVKTIINKANMSRILEEAENRDISQLTLISDKEYKTGLDKIRYDLNNSHVPVFDMSFLELKGTRIDSEALIMPLV